MIAVLALVAIATSIALHRRTVRHRDHAEQCLAAAARLHVDSIDFAMQAAEIAKAVLAGDTERARDLISLVEEQRG